MSQSQYATTTDLQNLAITPAAYNRFGAAAAGAALLSASSICDSYIVSQFELPLQTTPSNGWDQSLTMYTCWIAAFLLYSQFGYNPAAPADAVIESRYTKAIEWLENVRDKKIRPQWTSAQTAVDNADAAGDFTVTDDPVGFTSRGTVDNSGNQPQVLDGWFW